MSSVLDEVFETFEPSPEFVSVMAASKPAVALSLDIGTSGVRAALFDERGREIDGASARTNRILPASIDLDELDADELVQQVARTIDALFARSYQASVRIELVAISCFWHSLVGINSEGKATTPVLGWAETRAAQAAEELRSRFNETEIHARTGCRFHPSYWPAKLLWLSKERPSVFASTKRWLSFADYLTLRLFGETTTSLSLASGTGLLDQRTCAWDNNLARALDISVESLPEIASPDHRFIGLANEYALRWPQLSFARFFPAIADGAANNIGAGCVSVNRAALMIGTSGAMRVLYEGEPPAELPSELWCYRADRARVVVGGALSDGGGLYAWMKESLALNDLDESIERALGEIEPDSHGLTVLPFWAGERSSGWSTRARGAILGLTSRTRPIEILRASMEAVAYRFALIAGALDRIAPDATVVASGNALRASPVWTQMIADVLSRPVSLCSLSEASTRGAALIALEAAGKIDNIEAVAIPFERVYEPDARRHARYREGLERQQKIYELMISHRDTESRSK